LFFLSWTILATLRSTGTCGTWCCLVWQRLVSQIKSVSTCWSTWEEVFNRAAHPPLMPWRYQVSPDLESCDLGAVSKLRDNGNEYLVPVPTLQPIF
jgi:hypothetical protein